MAQHNHKNSITCPTCNTVIDVNEALLQQLELELKEKHKNEIAQLAKQQKEAFELERKKLTQTAMKEAQELLSQRFNEEKEKIYKQAEIQHTMKLKEKEHQLAQLTEQLKIANRKAEQASMQLQGEVQELAIEAWLSAQYPFDDIDEIQKGQKGADCLQSVHTREYKECGTIYYESKRTSAFNKEWIQKFKEDMRVKAADVGVIVTEQMPKGMDRMGMIDDVWICSFEEFKALSFVLRENIINIYEVRQRTQNSTSKRAELYTYLTGSEFKRNIETIVESFSRMRNSIDKERVAFEKIWTQREKELTKGLKSASGIYGTISGIAGASIPVIDQFDLDCITDDTTKKSA